MSTPAEPPGVPQGQVKAEQNGEHSKSKEEEKVGGDQREDRWQDYPEAGMGDLEAARGRIAEIDRGDVNLRKSSSRSSDRSGGRGKGKVLEISGIDRKTNRRVLEEAFDIWGDVERVEVFVNVKQKSSLTKRLIPNQMQRGGTATITFERESEAYKAYRKMDGERIDGSKISVSFAADNGGRRGGGGRGDWGGDRDRGRDRDRDRDRGRDRSFDRGGGGYDRDGGGYGGGR
eukprot:271676-Amorphochlora_amoeboformis.AAC.1